MWDLFLESLAVAARCQATVGLLTGTGAAAAAFGVLDTATVRGLSKFHLKFLNKCIIFQLNQFYSVERLVLWSCVPIVAIMHLALGAALGWLGGRLLRSPRRELLVLTTTFGNCGALPFVLIIPIIRNWSVTRDAPDEALETGFGVIGLCANPDHAHEIEHTIFTSTAHPLTRHRAGSTADELFHSGGRF